MDFKEALPSYSQFDELPARRRRWRRRRFIVRSIILVLLTYTLYRHAWTSTPPQPLSTSRLLQNHDHCAKLRHKPQDPSGHREVNARFNGAASVLVTGALVWTGEPSTAVSAADVHAGKGLEWRRLDVLLENGLIARVAEHISIDEVTGGCTVYNATGRMLTTGIIDMHTHAGVSTLPDTIGGNDDNELSDNITPYVRSLDGINPLDPQIQVIKSGGVTTSLVLPGSGNNMGGEAFVIKHAVGKPNGRPEISVQDMLADPDHNWRYMKMACGENAKRVYGRVGRSFGPFSRLGEAWYFRHAFEQAQRLVQAQDEWCAAADAIGAEQMSTYLPLELKWESLAAVLRGQVHVNTHCYTATDLEAFIRHSNEFKFPVRAFHHAHQTYLVPEVLKRNYGGRPPAAALFADNMYYKVESYIGSEQAGRILHENGITPVYVSDNPVLNAQHVVFEAAKAYKNGLPYHIALAGVTSASAELLGLGERIGKIKEGFDADLTLWDSDPLSVGATPVQVWIDGAAQFSKPVELSKPAAKPLMAVDREIPTDNEPTPHSSVCFSGVVSDVFNSTGTDGSFIFTSEDNLETSVQYVKSCDSNSVHVILEHGYVVRPATVLGSFLGLNEIEPEPSTTDGYNSADSWGAAVDGLFFDTKSLRAAFAHGVTRAISALPYSGSGHKGPSVGFRVNAKHALDKAAVWNSIASVHYSLVNEVKDQHTPSISNAVAELRGKLLDVINVKTNDGKLSAEQADLVRVVKGEVTLVVTVHKADTIASLLKVKTVVDEAIARTWSASSKTKAPTLKLVIFGGAEAHLLAKELAHANIGVVLASAFPYAVDWDQRRSLTGAPLTNGTAFDVLHEAGVVTAIGTAEDWEVRDLFLMAGIVHVNSGGRISAKSALDMISSNVYKMLQIEEAEHVAHNAGFVVFDGNPLEIQSRIRAVYDGTGEIHVWA